MLCPSRQRTQRVSRGLAGPTQPWEVFLEEFHSFSLGYQMAPGSPAGRALTELGRIGSARGLRGTQKFSVSGWLTPKIIWEVSDSLK